MYIFIRDLLMRAHHYCYIYHLPGEMWFLTKACHVQDRYID